MRPRTKYNSRSIARFATTLEPTVGASSHRQLSSELLSLQYLAQTCMHSLHCNSKKKHRDYCGADDVKV